MKYIFKPSQFKNLFVGFCFHLLTTGVNAQFIQQGSKLLGSDAVGTYVYQGNSVSLSSDGNTALIGGNYDNGGVGAAWVYTRSGGVWTQQGSKLVGSGAVGIAQQGGSVSLSSDGNTAIVGGYYDNSNAGAVWVYTRSGGIWTQQGGKLVGSGAVGAGRQGYSVSLSSDGNTAIVGGHSDNGNIGAAWVYTRSGGIWTQQGGKLVGSDAVGAGHQGYSVSLSSDGNTALVGGYADNSNKGAAWVYIRSGGIWTQQGSKLSDIASVYQGASVSLSSDGNTAILGENGTTGGVRVYTRSAGVWSKQGEELIGSGAVGAASQGYSVSLSSNGNTALVGGMSDSSGIGAVWVFTRLNGVWTQFGSKLIGSGAVGHANQGNSVSLSADGNTAMVGGFMDGSEKGATWVFVSPPMVPVLLSPTDTAKNVSVSPIMLWHMARANSYHAQVSTAADFSVLTKDTNLTDTSVSFSGLANNTQYYWRVSDTNSVGTGGWSVVRSFTTRPLPPSAPFLLSPADMAKDVSVNPVLFWLKANRATSYRTQISTTNDFSVLTKDTNLTDTSVNISGLTDGALFYWRVSDTNSGGTGGWSATRSFTTSIAQPSQIMVISPVSGDTIKSDSVLLSWHVGTPNVTGYHLEISADSTFTVGVNSFSSTDTSKWVGPLFNGATYYWHVRAQNTIGSGPYNQAVKFSVKISPVVLLPKEFFLQNLGLAGDGMVRFGLSRQAHVTANLFNLQGKLSENLINKEFDAGNYALRTDGIPKGLYILSFKANKYQKTVLFIKQ